MTINTKIIVDLTKYLGCAVLGAAASWYFTKKHYEKLVDEEIQSIRSVHNKVHLEENDTDMRNAYEYSNDLVEDLGYNKTKNKVVEPYLIPMETFDDADPAYEKISLEYYTEDNCLVENDEVIDPSMSIGIENLNRFAKRMDLIVMYIRNEQIGADYEVTKIVSKWSD